MLLDDPNKMRHIPAKGSIGIDNPEWVKGGVHCLLRGHQILHHRDAEVHNQTPQAQVEHLPHIVT